MTYNHVIYMFIVQYEPMGRTSGCLPGVTGALEFGHFGVREAHKQAAFAFLLL